jgi:hypothetical protein
VDHLGFVETVDRFGQSVVVAVADTADRWLDAGLGILGWGASRMTKLETNRLA